MAAVLPQDLEVKLLGVLENVQRCIYLRDNTHGFKSATATEKDEVKLFGRMPGANVGRERTRQAIRMAHWRRGFGRGCAGGSQRS